MLKWLQKLGVRGELWMQRNNQIAQFDDIRLCELSPRRPEWKRVMLAAFQLIKDIDPRRFARVNLHLKWVIDGPLWHGGAQYRHDTQTCVLDFVTPESESELPDCIAWYASKLIHEATHGVLRVRGIPYSPELRARIERLCVTEENRFLRRLASTQPDVATRLHREFD